jgi:hypothetical protein
MFSHAIVMHHAMTQYSLNKGLRKFQKLGEAAMSRELKQLHMWDTFAPQYSKNLTAKQKREALESMIFSRRNGTGPSKAKHVQTRGSNEIQPYQEPKLPQQSQWNQWW